MIQLLSYKANKLSIENTVKPGTQLKLQNQVKYNVNYMDADNKCLGILQFRITDSDMQPFEVKIDLVAEFSYDQTDEKADIHTESFDQIFPFIRQIVNSLASQCGINGLMIPIMHLNKSSVTVNAPNTDDESSLLN